MTKIKCEYRTISNLLPHIKSFTNTKIMKNNFLYQYSTSSIENANLTSNEFNFKNLEEQSIFYKGYFKSVKNQRDFMENLFIKFELKTMNDWTQIEISKIIQNGGVNLIKEYKKDIKLLFSSLYPNFPWDFSSLKIYKPKEYFKSIENQKQFMDNLFIKLKLNSLDDWVDINVRNINKNGGSVLIFNYRGNKKKLLKTIYPNHNWDFKKKIKKQPIIIINKKLKKQQREMDKLFKKLKLNSLDEWLNIHQFKIPYLKTDYERDFELFLSTIYPNYAWDFSKLKLSYKSISLQRKVMDKIFQKLKLNSLDDWKFVKMKKIVEFGGTQILRKYKHDFKLIMKTIYPEHNWSNLNDHFENIPISKSIEKQQKRMEKLFIKLKLNSLDDWLNVSRLKIVENIGGCMFYSLYNGKMEKLLTTIYPYYPWDFSNCNSKNSNLYSIIYFKSIENQREFMDNLFIKLNLNSFDDWMMISRGKILRYGGKSITAIYRDIKSLLSSIYPNYPWDFPNNYLLSFKIKNWIEKYNITQKKDWYRISDRQQTHKTLKIAFPYEKWKKSFFTTRKRKTTQRLLFAFTQKIYPSLLIFEDYFHPKIIESNFFELDIFIPALQLALEYQGEHHYDDIPSAFAGIDLFQDRDQEKEKLVTNLDIKIIYVPYWWDQSLSSLKSSLQSSL